MAIDISVILPNNNALPILRRMILSIPDSDRIQIIVVDNSPVPLKAESISEGRHNVEVYYSAPSRGAGGARNEGLLHATGRWILFADADDFFTPEAFQIIEKDLQSPCDIVYYDCKSCYSDTLQPANRNYVIRQYIDAYLNGDDSFLRYFWDSPWCKLIRRSLVEEHHVRFEEVPAGNDMGFSVRVGTYARQVKAVDKPVYCVTIHEGSIIHSPSVRNIESRFKSMVRLNTFLRHHHLRRYRHSVMRLWIMAWKRSPLLALKLWAYSIKKGNSVFIGCSRWFHTARLLHTRKPQV